MSRNAAGVIDGTGERTVRTVGDPSYALTQIPSWVKRAPHDHRLERDEQLELTRQFGVETVNYTFGRDGVRKRSPKRSVEVDRDTKLFVTLRAGTVVQYLREGSTMCFVADVQLSDGRVVQLAFGRAGTVRMTAYGHRGN